MAPDDDVPPERELTAYHEAGHAVAAAMRGGGELRSITIEPSAAYLGHTGFRCKPCDTAFVTYAGPWAEARVQWPLPSLDGEDEDGASFEDYVAAAFLRNAGGDGEDYRHACEADQALLGERFAELVATREQFWGFRELDEHWPAVQAVAQLLIAGAAPTDAAVRALVDRPRIKGAER
ncbi:hypothetical protein [Mycobacterium servetii]|uniref:Peptidase M41 domain-containing protein n=1 Tax=Mycobacterium servetii TaxID=3237418 RepID=A0ABV4C1U0_9MYCO